MLIAGTDSKISLALLKIIIVASGAVKDVQAGKYINELPVTPHPI